MKSSYQIVIVGGGNAGISVASQLLRKDKQLDIALIDPAKYHYYQPAWTLVGGGVYDVNKTQRPQKDVMPDRLDWIKQKVVGFKPQGNKIELDSGQIIGYDFLVVCPGIQINWNNIEGLSENLGQNGVCSNYSFETAPYTFDCIKNFKGGKALFTNPGTTIKCGGAPQKIMYLASDYFRKNGILKDTEVYFCSAGKALFGIQKYRDALMKVVKRYGIKLCFGHDLTKIDGKNKVATFKVKNEDGTIEHKEMKFDMIHATPPQGPPDFIAKSELANDKGWVDVDKLTTQHNKFANVFSLGDASSIPAAKTGAAIRKQAPVLVANLLKAMQGGASTSEYGGYGSCPIVTGYGKLILAEFDYSKQPAETFPFDQSKERYSMYLLKTKVLPWLYWNRILKGTA